MDKQKTSSQSTLPTPLTIERLKLKMKIMKTDIGPVTEAVQFQ